MTSIPNLLRGNSDEERFAGLLLTVKRLQAADTSSKDKEELLESVYRHLGPRFLRRLVRSRGKEPLHGSVAAHIVAALATLPRLAAKLEDMVVFLVQETLPSLPPAKQEQEQEDQKKQDDQEQLPRLPLDVSTLEALVAACGPERAADVAHFVEPALELKDEEGGHDAFRLYARAVPLTDDRQHHLFLPGAARMFAEAQDKLKFRLLPLVLLLVLKLEDIQKKDGEWAVHVREGLKDLMRNLVDDTVRRMSLVLSDAMLRHMPWGSAWARADLDFLHVLMNVVSIESNVLLMMARAPEDASFHDTINDALPHLTLQSTVVACIDISVTVVALLVEGDWHTLPADTLLPMQRRLTDVFDSCCQFMREAAEEQRETHRPVRDEVLALASMRFVGLWVVEDGSAEALDTFRELLPFMRTLKRGQNGEDPMELVQDAIQALDL